MAISVNPRQCCRTWVRIGLGAGIVLAALAAGSCASPKVKYQQAAVLDAGSLRSASATAFLFRVPRSQIVLSPDSGEKRIHPAVLDPVPTGDWIALPFNPGFYYRIAITQDMAGTLSVEAFRAAFGRNVRAFPVPSCRTAHLEIGVAAENAAPDIPPLRLKLEAVATEYDYPHTDGTVPLSPLFMARPKRGWFSATRLNAVKYPNTHIVKTIGVEVEDHFAKALTALVGIAKTAAGMMHGIPPAQQDIVTAFASSLTVADNRRIALAPLPRKGSINLHPVCGADVSEQGSTTGLDFLENAHAAMSRAKELYDVWNARE